MPKREVREKRAGNIRPLPGPISATEINRLKAKARHQRALELKHRSVLTANSQAWLIQFTFLVFLILGMIRIGYPASLPKPYKAPEQEYTIFQTKDCHSKAWHVKTSGFVNLQEYLKRPREVLLQFMQKGKPHWVAHHCIEIIRVR